VKRENNPFFASLVTQVKLYKKPERATIVHILHPKSINKPK
jgi:hypothetical protein